MIVRRWEINRIRKRTKEHWSIRKIAKDLNRSPKQVLEAIERL